MIEAAVQIFVRKAVQGEALSVLIQQGGQEIEIALSPAAALGIAHSLIEQTRVSLFGEVSELQPGDLDPITIRPWRVLDVVEFSLKMLREDLKQSGAAPDWPNHPPGIS